MLDPLTELVVTLERDGVPPLAWVVRHSRSGEEPVARAWRLTYSPESQVRVLELMRDPRASEARRVLNAVFISPTADRDRMRADAIRRLVPEPPTLMALLTTVRPRMGLITWAGAA